MAAHMAGYTDCANLDGIAFTSRHNKIGKSPEALKHSRELSLQATANLAKIRQFEHLLREADLANNALSEFVRANPGQYIFRPAYCSAIEGQLTKSWIPSPATYGRKSSTSPPGWLHLKTATMPKGLRRAYAQPTGSSATPTTRHATAPASAKCQPHQTSSCPSTGGPAFTWNLAAPTFTPTLNRQTPNQRSTWKVERMNQFEP